MVLRDIRESGGGLVAASDAAMLDGHQNAGKVRRDPGRTGSAAAFAGLRAALDDGLLERHERAVVLVTGTGLKSLQYLQPAAQPCEVQGSLEEVERALRQI